jgi:hypothetical protein
MYGPRAYLRTNAQRFRNNADVARAVPSGRLRIICSGDSFTLGYGVSNDDAWCNRLAVLDHRIDAINMGQGGYGIDQAYLKYTRDASSIDHDVQILAFITEDFGRMRSATFLGYPKPVLVLDHGALAVRNVPVPVRSELGVKARELVRPRAPHRLAWDVAMANARGLIIGLMMPRIGPRALLNT